jgi:predicted ATP-dependent endonuclease of OLD family
VPEAFLHPGQQELLNASLSVLSSQEDQQIVIATQAPVFVSQNIEEICKLVKLRRDYGISHTFQVS